MKIGIVGMPLNIEKMLKKAENLSKKYICLTKKECVVEKNIDGFLEGDLGDKILNSMKEQNEICPSCKYDNALSLGYGVLKDC